jgi:Skp family chaperone for outer membrane proteins
MFIALALLAGIVITTNSGLQSQDKKDSPKVKGQLPQNWGKLELSADQKQAIYRVQAKYKEEIAKMREKIKDIEAEERREMVKLLSDEQKKKLQELATGESKEESKKGK